MKSLGPCFSLYHDDFLGGVQGFSAAEVGAYVLLLIEQWRAGSVPKCGRKLSRISRQKPAHLTAVLEKFHDDGNGGLINDRMHALRCERIAFIEKQARNAKTRWAQQDDATALPPHMPPHMPNGMPNACSPSPSPSPPTVKTERERAEVPQDTPGQVRYIQQARDDWRLSAVDIENELKAMPTGPERAEVVRQFCADAYNGDKPRNPIGMLRGYISTANAPAKGATPARRPFPEQRKKAIEDLLRPLTSKSYPTDADRAEIQRLRNELKEVNNAIATG